MVPRGEAAPGGVNVVAEPVYGSARGYSPPMSESLRVLGRLLRPDRAAIYHFFFAPNPTTNRVARLALGLKRRRVVHTVASEPSGEVRWFADVHVALTEATAEQLRRAGAPDVRVIRPGVPVAPARSRDVARATLHLPARMPIVLFAGDLIDGGGADVLAESIARLEGIHAVFACRPKGQGHVERRKRLARRLGSKATWFGEVDDMASLIAAADVQCLPARTLRAKVDLPLVLLEGLASGIPAVVPDAAPLSELGGSEDGVLRVAGGDPEALSRALSELFEAPKRREALSRAARKAGSERWSAARMARDYEILWDELEGGR